MIIVERNWVDSNRNCNFITCSAWEHCYSVWHIWIESSRNWIWIDKGIVVLWIIHSHSLSYHSVIIIHSHSLSYHSVIIIHYHSLSYHSVIIIHYHSLIVIAVLIIIHYHCYCYSPSQKIYIVMELLRGGELYSNICGRSILKEHEAYRIIRPLTECLAYLHRMGIIHRDIKVLFTLPSLSISLRIYYVTKICLMWKLEILGLVNSFFLMRSWSILVEHWTTLLLKWLLVKVTQQKRICGHWELFSIFCNEEKEIWCVD